MAKAKTVKIRFQDARILAEIVRWWLRDGHKQPRRQGVIDAPPLPHGVLFAVRVWQDGGTTDGDGTTQCDRTYIAADLDAVFPSSGDAGDTTGYVYGTELTPVKRRPETGELDCPPASGDGVVGMGYYDFDGAFQLWDANERLNTDTC